jgi:bifunctional N-acetylglucosamine-1-phosphate-uridyltransferase/glucosamine-1-phosphate-acetyltransferase GlmU-like protein
MEAIALILAAGKGTRMRSSLPKPIVPFLGKPLVSHIINAFYEAKIKEVFLVVGYGADQVMSTIGPSVGYVQQQQQNGTAHAVLQGKTILPYQGKNIFVFVGDSPLISAATIKRLKEHHENSGAVCTFLTADFPTGFPYARVIRDSKGSLAQCVEEKNATEDEKKLTELLSSHFIFNADALFEALPKIEKDPENGEYYLTDSITVFLKEGKKVEAFKIDSYFELAGLNTPEEVTWAEEIKKEQATGIQTK